ncbi:VOC family protein [Uliginosibacterium sp. H1]|uniref:VOC family protein n=1 Tax=Uliginosibacterium sp. H1 TaxID=3114757 RepID=UPI002E16BD59|nr:VOC family protein [Uliginosibacterium sp. H1]
MSLTILLRCHDVEQTRAFYRSRLGFDLSDTAEGTLTAVLHGGALVFTPADLWGAAPGFTGTIYLAVPALDDYYATVKDGVSLAWPLQDMPYGSREFGIRDCNGYYLAFRQQA